MVTVEFTRRVPVNGFWLLPGTRAEFATAGQAGMFTVSGAAKIVNDNSKRSSKASTNARKGDRSRPKTDHASTGEGVVQSRSE